MTIIEAHNISKRFGDITAVEDLNLEVDEGEVLGFLGPNGAGKTTAIRILSGLSEPSSGEVIVSGFDASKQPEYKLCAVKISKA